MILSANDTVVEVQITSMLDTTSHDVEFYLPIGIPSGSDELMNTVGINLKPSFQSVSPNIGSPGGSLLMASVPGVGINTKNVML